MGTLVLTHSRRYSCKHGTLSFFRFDDWPLPLVEALDDAAAEDEAAAELDDDDAAEDEAAVEAD